MSTAYFLMTTLLLLLVLSLLLLFASFLLLVLLLVVLVLVVLPKYHTYPNTHSQVTGKVPIVNIDKTDGCMLYLSQKSLDTQVVTAKSSEMNVMVPDAQNEYVSTCAYVHVCLCVILMMSPASTTDHLLHPSNCITSTHHLTNTHHHTKKHQTSPTHYHTSPTRTPQKELPIPEQFKTYWNGQKLVTEVTDVTLG